MSTVAIISGYYGIDQYISLNHKIKNFPSYFVTNNLTAAKKAEKLGWIVCLMMKPQ